jgi:hypothetical protein
MSASEADAFLLSLYTLSDLRILTYCSFQPAEIVCYSRHFLITLPCWRLMLV